MDYNNYDGAAFNPKICLLNWTIEDIHNEMLMEAYLHEIPTEFGDYDDYYSFYPHIIEEFRANISAGIMKRVETFRIGDVVPLITRYGDLVLEISNMKEELSNQTTYMSPTLIIQTNTISNEILKQSNHFFGATRKFIEKKDFPRLFDRSSGITHNSNKQYILVDIAGMEENDMYGLTPQMSFLHQNSRSSGWMVVIIDSSLIAFQRTYEAIRRGNACQKNIMRSLYSGEVAKNSHGAPYEYDAKVVELADHVSTRNNDSQRTAILAILAAKSPITIVHGPPGTGKTSTLIPAIKGLLLQGKRVHVTAPTNQAVCELARRLVKSIPENGYREYADIVLVGSASRLIMDDAVVAIHLDSRVDRIIYVLKNWDADLDTFIEVISSKQLLLDRLTELYSTSVTGFVGYVCKYLSDAFDLLCQHSLVVFKDWPQISYPYKWADRFNAISEAFQEYLSSLEGLNSKELSNWLSSSQGASHGELGNIFEILHDTLHYRVSLAVIRPEALNMDIFECAKVVFSTVNVAGKKMFSAQENNFDVLIIDEATQLVEAETLIAFTTQVTSLILAGDHKQLPSTVISGTSKGMGYGRSLFERLVVHHQYPAYLLNTQYRMHPLISAWPSYTFYNDKVLDAEGISYKKPWHDVFPPISLYDASQGQEVNERNMVEFQIVIGLLQQIKKDVFPLETAFSIGIISPYAAQVEILSQRISRIPLDEGFTISVRTVDGFQGQECDMIIVSTVRANKRGSLGFVKDRQRLNVAITRARYSLMVVGDRETLSTNADWRSLLDYIQFEGMINNTQNSAIMKTVDTRMKNEKIITSKLLDFKCMLFESKACIWSAEFSDDFKKSLPKLPGNSRLSTFRELLTLVQGAWAKPHMYRSNLVSAHYRDMINISEIGEVCLIWTVDLRSHKAMITQYIRVWDVVGCAVIPRWIKRLENEFRVYSTERLERSSVRLTTRPAPPVTWPIDPLVPFQWTKEVPKISHSSASIEEVPDEVHESLSLMKFYDVKSPIVHRMVTMRPEDYIALPHTVSDEERELIFSHGSLFILGRSGTGKTTVMLQRIFIQSPFYQHIAQQGISQEFQKENYNNNSVEIQDASAEFCCRQILITASPVLCTAIKANYESMKKTAIECRGVALKVTVEDTSQPTLEMKRLDSYLPDEFPLIITYSHFLKSLDLCSQSPFFPPPPTTSTSSYSNRAADSSTTSFSSISSSDRRHTISHEQLREIDFPIFKNEYYPRLGLKPNTNLTADVVYTEIMSCIKGSMEALHSQKGRLNKEDYSKFAERRSSTFDAAERSQIYEVYVKYERLKAQSYDYDIPDAIYHVVSDLHRHPYRGPLMNNVLVDEVQDLLPVQIYLFRLICNDLNGFVFAGDTAQTIAQGVGFRFETVKDIFHHEFIGNNRGYTVPQIHFLTKNFRTHSGIIKAAAFNVSLLIKFFPDQVDKLKPETAMVEGPLPIFLQGNVDVISELFSRGDVQKTEFGAEQVILVRDDETKVLLQKTTGMSALVLTCAECKGMEFTDVLIYNFFSSGRLGSKWRVLRNFDVSDMCPGTPTFDEKQHFVFCRELKMLYVLLTRTKQRLVIFDEDKDARLPLMEMLHRRNLVELKEFDEDIRTILKSKSLPEEWCARGHEFLSRKNYADARMCFHRGGDQFHENMCLALFKKQEAHKLSSEHPVDSKQLFNEAAELFRLIGNLADAAECFKLAGAYQAAGEAYESISESLQAAECFKKAKCWYLASISYSRCGHILELVDCCYELSNYNQAFNLINDAVQDEASKQSYLQMIHRKWAEFHHNRRETAEMMALVVQFDDKVLKRKFLTRRGYLEKLADIEISEGNYEAAGELLYASGEYNKASDCFHSAKNHVRAAECLLQLLRRSMYEDNLRFSSDLAMKI